MTSVSRRTVGRTVKESQPIFLIHKYQARPAAINVTSHPSTIDILENPAHPFYIRFQRRMKEFDPKGFHLSVRSLRKVSNKKFIRQSAMQRVRRAFEQALEQKGLDNAGRPLKDKHDGTTARIAPLAGALLILLPNDTLSLTATDEELRYNVNYVLEKVLSHRKRPFG